MKLFHLFKFGIFFFYLCLMNESVKRVKKWRVFKLNYACIVSALFVCTRVRSAKKGTTFDEALLSMAV